MERIRLPGHGREGDFTFYPHSSRNALTPGARARCFSCNSDLGVKRGAKCSTAAPIRNYSAEP